MGGDMNGLLLRIINGGCLMKRTQDRVFNAILSIELNQAVSAYFAAAAACFTQPSKVAWCEAIQPST